MSHRVDEMIEFTKGHAPEGAAFLCAYLPSDGLHVVLPVDELALLDGDSLIGREIMADLRETARLARKQKEEAGK